MEGGYTFDIDERVVKVDGHNGSWWESVKPGRVFERMGDIIGGRRGVPTMIIILALPFDARRVHPPVPFFSHPSSLSNLFLLTTFNQLRAQILRGKYHRST